METFVALVPCCISQDGIQILIDVGIYDDYYGIIKDKYYDGDISPIETAAHTASEIFAVDKAWLQLRALTPKVVGEDLILPFQLMVPKDVPVQTDRRYAWCGLNEKSVMHSEYSDTYFEAVRNAQ